MLAGFKYTYPRKKQQHKFGDFFKILVEKHSLGKEQTWPVKAKAK